MSKYEVTAETDLAIGQQIAVKVGGVNVLVFHLETGFYATQSSCTHLFMPLKKGKIIDGCNIQCPIHRAQFDIKTGEVVTWANFPPGIQLLNALRKEKPLTTYPVSIEAGKVWVEVG